MMNSKIILPTKSETLFVSTSDQIVFVAFILFFLFMFYFLKRNHDVFDFRSSLRRKCLEFDLQNIENGSYHEITNNCGLIIDSLPSYYKMVFSFKPLKIEKWLTEEQVKKLKN